MRSHSELKQSHFFLISIRLMIQREFHRIKSEPSRLMGILVQPLLFLVVFGGGFHNSFVWSQAQDIAYNAFFYPGILGLVVLFSSIYATLTLVEDKKCGLFRMVALSGGGIGGALMGKISATAILGFFQACLFLPLMFVLSLSCSVLQLIEVGLFLALGALSCALLGVLFAWISPSSSAFHALMSVILIPMWLLSGAMFPLDGTWMEVISVINPMSHLVLGLRTIFLKSHFLPEQCLFLLLFSFLISVLLTIVVNKRPLE